jgi:prefoldin subunit 5
MVTMSLEGPAVFEQLDVALSRAKNELARCHEEATRLDDAMRDLLARRGEALLGLARHYLPEISRAAIQSTFEGIRSDLLTILARREAKRDDLKSRLDQGNEEIRRRNAEIDDVTRRLNEKVALREKLEAAVAETLKGNADFQERSKLALQAEEKLHRDESRVEELARESTEKLPAYDRSRLFRYLHDRGYSTPDYKPSDWVRRLDRWVADLIDYPNALNGYEFLKKTPELVAAEVSRRRDQFAELMKQVEAIEKDEADRAGLTAVLAEGDALGLERDRLVQELGRLQKDAEAIQQQLAGLQTAQDEFYRQAIERFRSFLGETKLALLEKRARQTPEPEDDAIVAELAGLDEQIEGIGPSQDDLNRRRKAADRVKEGLDRVIRQYRQANYDSERSYFEGVDPAREIARLEDGQIDADDLWESIRSAQNFRPSWVQQTASNGIQVAASPAGRVILGALVDIAGAAMREAAYRGVQRRSDSSFPTFPSPGSFDFGSSSRTAAPDSSNSASEGGFTSGEGF